MALFKTIDEFIEHVSVNKNATLKAMMPDILLVEREQIKSLLGAEIYTKLHEGYTSGSLEGKQLELLKLVQYSLANLAMVSYMALNQVQVSDGGITKSEHSAYRYQIRELKLNLITKGYNGLESVLEFLEEHKNDEKIKGLSTLGSVIVTKNFFINSAREFTEEYNINGSRLTYLSLQSIIKKVEFNLIEKELGTALYDELKAQISKSEVSPDNKLLLDKYIRPAVAHFVAAKAIAERSFKFSGDTISLNLEELVDDTSRGATTNNDALLMKKIEQAYQDGYTFMSKMKDFLNKTASAEKYKAYFESELYTSATAEPVVYRNAANATIFAFI
jgi:hypothetical protein